MIKVRFRPKTKKQEDDPSPAGWAPGWYPETSSIRWWDGKAWTELTFPKRWGISWGGGTFRASLIAALVALTVATGFLVMLIGFVQGASILGYTILSLCVLALYLIAAVAGINAFYVRLLRKRVEAYRRNLMLREAPMADEEAPVG
jgi:hypothetical protein